MEGIELVGQIAGALTTLSMLPQVVKSWKSKSTGDISLSYLAVLGAGVFLWLVYGLFISSWPVVLWNAVNEILVLALVFLKIRHG